MSLRKSFKETSVPRPAPRLQTLFAQFSNSQIVSNAALKRDGREFGQPWRFPGRAGITAFAVRNDLGRAPQATYLTDACNVTAIPFDAELGVFVRIKTLRINGELSNGRNLLRSLLCV